MRVVLDTNVLVRAAADPVSPPGQILGIIREDPSVTLVVSVPILREVQAVLARPYFRDKRGVSAELTERFVAALERAAALVEPASGPPVIADDPDDDQIVYTAVAGRADVLCSWDAHLWRPEALQFCTRRSIRVIRDGDLLAELRQRRG